MSEKPTCREPAHEINEKDVTNDGGQPNKKIESKMNPQIQIPDVGIDAIIDAEEIQAILDDLYNLTHMATAILDLEGRVMGTSGWQDICTKFHRIHPETQRNCTKADLFLATKLKPGEYTGYKCGNGLWDVVTPLYIGPRHMGNIYAGQFFYDDEEVDEVFFINNAKRYGFDKDAYLDAFRRIPRHSRETVEQVMGFLVKFATYISRVGFANIELKKEIREHKQADEALKESEARLRTLIRAIPDLVWLKDQQGSYLFCNARFESFFGAKEKNIVGKTDYDFVDRDLADFFRKHDNAAIVERAPIRNEEKVTFADDGHGEILETIKSPIYKSDGRVAGVLGIGRDITERKRVEKALSESEARLSQIVMGSPVPTLVIDNNHVITHWNTALEKVTGISGSSVIGTNAQWRAFYSAERPILADLIVDNVDEHTVTEFYSGKYRKSPGIENAYEAEDFFPELGKEGKWLFFTAAPLRNSSGETIGAVETLQDTTARKKAEQALRESEEKYRLLVEFANDAIFIAQNGVVKFPNPKALDLIGYSEEELGNISFSDLIYPEDRKEVLERHKRGTSGETLPNAHSFRIVHKTGRHLIVQINSTPITWEEKPATLNFLRDITDQKMIENQLYHAHKMEAIGTLAGGIAHDFNNILSGIFGYTQLLQLKMKKDSEMRVYLDSILKAGNRAKDLVKQILTFSRQSVNELKPIEIQEVIKEALKLMASSLPSTISIRRKIQKDCGPVLADATQIHQVIMNLGTNAYHAMEKRGGELSVDLREVELNAKDLKERGIHPGKFVRLTVADTGDGMSQGVLDRIFDPYFTTKEEGRGTGLGLAVIHGIVKSHGGHILVESEPGKGTEFHIYLPVIKPAEDAPQAVTRLSIQKGNERILLVDDQKEVLDIVQHMLEALGYRVTAKNSSVDTLHTFRTDPDHFDLVITDMTMPGMTGDMLAAEIFKIRPDVPIILCTGFSEQISEKKAKSLGIGGFLMKPVVLDDLSVMVRNLLDDK